MASNKKKIFVTQTMARGGRALLAERDDIELIEFPNMISAADFEALLKTHAPVHGVVCATRDKNLSHEWRINHRRLRVFRFTLARPVESARPECADL